MMRKTRRHSKKVKTRRRLKRAGAGYSDLPKELQDKISGMESAMWKQEHKQKMKSVLGRLGGNAQYRKIRKYFESSRSNNVLFADIPEALGDDIYTLSEEDKYHLLTAIIQAGFDTRRIEIGTQRTAYGDVEYIIVYYPSIRDLRNDELISQISDAEADMQEMIDLPRYTVRDAKVNERIIVLAADVEDFGLFDLYIVVPSDFEDRIPTYNGGKNRRVKHVRRKSYKKHYKRKTRKHRIHRK